MQVIVMTSDNYHHLLGGFLSQWDKYFSYSMHEERNIVVCSFTQDKTIKTLKRQYDFRFYSIGNFTDYPANKWSDALINVLDNVADKQFVLMLEDYWLCRPVDVTAVKMLYDYAKQFENVLKIDLCADRLNSDPQGYFYNFNTYDNCGYLDLIKSPQGRQYQMSLWAGVWNREQMKRFIIPGERAQEIELNGTTRVNHFDDVLVLGTRQQPVLHANIIQSGKQGPIYKTDSWKIKDSDLEELRKLGYVK